MKLSETFLNKYLKKPIWTQLFLLQNRGPENIAAIARLVRSKRATYRTPAILLIARPDFIKMKDGEVRL